MSFSNVMPQLPTHIVIIINKTFTGLENVYVIFGDFRLKTCSSIKVHSLLACFILNYFPLNTIVRKEWIGLQRETIWFNGNCPTHEVRF